MTGIEIHRYSATDKDRWNEFVGRSKNGTFLFDRGFMDYHGDRFSDHSLMAMSGGKLVALLPANEVDGQLVSHGGLTYGGFVTNTRMQADTMLEVTTVTIDYARGAGFRSLLYKPVPHFYHRAPAEEDLYALFRAGARPIRVEASCAIRIGDRLPFSKSRRHGVKRALNAGVEVRESTDWSMCWQILESVLASRHDARPTHSLDEIRLLAGRFPDQIRLFGAFIEQEMIAALVIFDCAPAVHVQYIASTATGRDLGGVDVIVDHLLGTVFKSSTWFDFGISTEDEGRVLNTGLARQKEMFGARTVIYQHLGLNL